MKSVNLNQLAKQLKMPANLLTKILIQKNILIEDSNEELSPTKYALEKTYCYTIMFDTEETMFTSAGVRYIEKMLTSQYCAVI